MSFTDMIGWSGAFLLLLAFVLNIFKKIDANSYAYLLLNAISSGMLLYSAWVNGMFPFVVVNFTWMIFSIVRTASRLIRNPH